MSASFKFCGKLKEMKETEKFKPVDTKEFTSGWVAKNLKFQGINGTNKHFLTVKAFYEKEESKRTLRVLERAEEGETENGKKSKPLTVAFKDRFDPDIVARVVPYNKYVIDLNKHGGEKDETKKHEYIFAGDFIDAIEKLLKNENAASMKFFVVGDVDIQYDSERDKFYKNYTVRKISIAAEDEEERMELSGNFVFNNDSWDEDSFEDTGRIVYNCWTQYYDSKYRNDTCEGRVFAPFRFVIAADSFPEEKRKKSIALFKNRLADADVEDSENGYATVDIVADVIDGASVEEVKFEDLPEDRQNEIKDEVEAGWWDSIEEAFENEKRKMGSSAYGERISELRIKRCGNIKGAVYDDTDMCRPTHDDEDEEVMEAKKKVASTESSKKTSKASSDDDDDDLFDLDI